jgi:hypothetical protein
MKLTKTIALLFFSSFILLSCRTNTQENQSEIYLFSYFTGNGEDGLHLAYSNDGLAWKTLKNGQSFLTPAVGKDKLMRDPCIIQGPNGLFHMVWTVSWNEKGIGYANSKDLITWSEQKYIPVMEHEPLAKNCWAPEIYWDDHSKQYLIFWATTIPGRFPETDVQGNPNRIRNHRMYYTTTKDFEIFAGTNIFYNHGFNVIDATLYKHKNKYVMFLKDETDGPLGPQKNIRIAYSDHAIGPYSKPSEPIHGKYWAEGPTVLKTDSLFYVYYDKYRKGKYGLSVSKDLTNWEDWSNKLTYPNGLRHGTVFKVSAAILAKLLTL